MNNTCPKHGEYWKYAMRCPKCKDDEDRQFVWFTVVVIVCIIAISIFIRYEWAKHVYHDTRCVWAECRIVK